MKKALLAMAVGVSMAASTGYSQPVQGEGKAQNPQTDMDKVMEQGMAAGMEAAKKIRTMTPAQLRDYMVDLQEKGLRAQMRFNGLDDIELQNRVLLFMREQGAASLPLRQASARLRDAVANKDSTQETLSALLAEHDAAIDTERARRTVAAAALREKMQMDKNPRLESFLRLYGILGDSSQLTGGSMMLPDTADLPKR